jgi:SAM-dependent methyltransferase
MTNTNNLAKKRMTFDVFRDMAKDDSLSKFEKIGFPDEYRKDFEDKIFLNIKSCLKLGRKNISVFDIGCGASDLPNLIIRNAENLNQKLFFVDSPEMLDGLPDTPILKKMPFRFPDQLDTSTYLGKIDAVLIYSVLQHVILDMNPFNFLDNAVKLLKEGGRLLIGDIPNISKRNRFFASNNGLKFHQKFTKTKTKPEFSFNTLIEDKADDSLIFSILQRYRSAGFETYLLEQPSSLPMFNRREDILIVRN